MAEAAEFADPSAGTAQSEAAASKKRSRYEDPEAFMLEIISRADDELGTGAAEILGAVAGAALALFVAWPYLPI